MGSKNIYFLNYLSRAEFDEAALDPYTFKNIRTPHIKGRIPVGSVADKSLNHKNP